MAGTHVIDAVQLGFNSDASRNFVLETLNNGTMRLARGNKGATTQDILVIGIDGKVAIEEGIAQSVLTSGTPVTLTNQTAVDFTGIPSWVKRITVMFSEVSTNGTSGILVQIGSGSIQTSSYVSSGGEFNSSNTTAVISSTAGFVIRSLVASNAVGGNMLLNLIGSNLWNESHSIKITTTSVGVGGGAVQLSGTLDRIRITTVNGTDTFDAGTVNIIYE